MYVVTGGAGFIGSNIVRGLAERGLGPIVVVDWLKEDERWRNIAKHELADIVLPENLVSFLEAHASSLKAIIHMGAISATTERDASRVPPKYWIATDVITTSTATVTITSTRLNPQSSRCFFGLSHMS